MRSLHHLHHMDPWLLSTVHVGIIVVRRSMNGQWPADTSTRIADAEFMSVLCTLTMVLHLSIEHGVASMARAPVFCP